MDSKQIFFAVATLIFGSASSFIIDSMKSSGSYPFKPAVAVLIVESVKWIVSLCMLTGDIYFRGATVPTFHLQSFMKFLIPGIVYMINNNLAFYALKYLTAPLFSLLSNLKVFFTALAMILILKRQFSKKVYIALGMLFLGVCLTQIKPGTEYSADSLTGIMIPVFMSFFSGFAGVYTEYLFKDKSGPEGSDHIAWQNLQLYTFGIILNSVEALREAGSFVSLFDGITFGNIWLIFLLAMNGILISGVIKFLDSLFKTYIFAFSTIMVTIVSFFYYEDFSLNFFFFVGTAVVTYAIVLYNKEKDANKEVPQEEQELSDKLSEQSV
eukprot:TRINITY_DN13471_c0_g2_i1.p1 TRINITY_DN13471_c0_g2~~TRINITY_DN13471_c0_g2_i1.p1  ORF type:complete len:343 (-),score=58.16 TRINITY_DN13471_c0_g2_i1:33-1007(-)